MKKTVLMIVVLFAAIFANAQISLEHTFDVVVRPILIEMTQECITDDDIIYVDNEETQMITLYDASSYDIVQTLHYQGVSRYFAKNLFTTDNTYATLCSIGSHSAGAHYYVYDATGQTVIADLGTYYYQDSPFCIYKTISGYKLAIYGRYESTSAPYGTVIFSLPGSGVSMDVSEVSTPHHNARKYIHNDQVLIDNNDKTYTLTGQEVK